MTRDERQRLRAALQAFERRALILLERDSQLLPKMERALERALENFVFNIN